MDYNMHKAGHLTEQSATFTSITCVIYDRSTLQHISSKIADGLDILRVIKMSLVGLQATVNIYKRSDEV